MIEKMVYAREWKRIGSGYCIQISIVHAKSVSAILFPDHNYWTGPGTVGRLHNSCLLHTLQLSSNFLTDCKGHSVWGMSSV